MERGFNFIDKNDAVSWIINGEKLGCGNLSRSLMET